MDNCTLPCYPKCRTRCFSYHGFTHPPSKNQHESRTRPTRTSQETLTKMHRNMTSVQYCGQQNLVVAYLCLSCIYNICIYITLIWKGFPVYPSSVNGSSPNHQLVLLGSNRQKESISRSFNQTTFFRGSLSLSMFKPLRSWKYVSLWCALTINMLVTCRLLCKHILTSS